MTQVLGRAVESLVTQPWHLPSVLSAFDRLPAYDLVIGARTGARLVAGADEVGIACLAAPLVAAACLFDWKALTSADLDGLAGLNDPKKLKPARCRELRTVITALAKLRRAVE